MTDEIMQPAPDASAQAVETKPQGETLPDTTPNEGVDVAKELEQKLAAEKAVWEKEKADLLKEKDTFAKRLIDTQDYLSRTRNLEKETPKSQPAVAAKTFDDYLKDTLQKFEDDPKAGLEKVIKDFAFDRELERENYNKQIADAQESAFRRVLNLDPEKAKVFSEVERLDTERPDLKNLTFEQKAEWINKERQVTQTLKNREQVDTDRSLAMDVGGDSKISRDRLPSWANDSEILTRTGGQFKSKKEMVDWSGADYNKAVELLKRRVG